MPRVYAHAIGNLCPLSQVERKPALGHSLCAKSHIEAGHMSLALPRGAMFAGKEVPMNTRSTLADVLRLRSNDRATTGSTDAPQPPHLLPRTAADELPPYRDELADLDRRRRREHDPAWTLAPTRQP